jgi:hypothetical protein
MRASLGLRLLSKYGAVTVIALYLVWQLTQTLPAMARTLDAHVADSQRQILLLRAICLGINTAEPARSMCEVSR